MSLQKTNPISHAYLVHLVLTSFCRCAGIWKWRYDCFVQFVGIAPREWGAHRNQDHNWYLSMMLYGVELPMIVRHQMREMMKSLGGLDLARKWKSSLGTEMTAQLRNKNPTRRIIHPCGVVRCWWIYTKRAKDYCSKLMRHSSLSAMFLVFFFLLR